MNLRRVGIFLAIVIGLCWFSSLNGPFHFDDSHSIESNHAIRSLSGIPELWTSNVTSSSIPDNRVYRPLVYTLYAFCWKIGGGKTWPFHVMKLGMHWMVCLMIFLCWRRLWSVPGWLPLSSLQIQFPRFRAVFPLKADWAALLLAAVFAVHPATAECVDYIAATTSLQAAMFYLLAFWFYLQFHDSKKPKQLLLSLLMYFLSVASKEEGITLPAMIFVSVFFLENDLKTSLQWKIRKAVENSLPYVVLGLVLAGWLYLMHSSSGDKSRGFVSPMHYFMTEWRAYLWYMRLWFWPWELNADFTEFGFSTGFSDPRVIQAAIGNGLILFLAWMGRRKFPAFLFGMIWFYVTISPASSIVPLAEPVNEHRMYLSYFGFIGGTATLLYVLAEKLMEAGTAPRKLGWIMTVIVAALAWGSQERSKVWSSSQLLWEDTVAKNPTSGRSLNNLALIYMAKGDYPKALELLERCERHWSGYVVCHLNKGITYLGLKNYELAGKSLTRAHELDRDSIYVNFQLGRYHEDFTKDDIKAAEYFRRGDELSAHRYLEAKVRLAHIYIRAKKWTDVRKMIAEIKQIEPGNAEARAIEKELK